MVKSKFFLIRMPFRDIQQEAALFCCLRCGQEVYSDDPVCELDPGLVHLDCSTPEEQSYGQIAPAYRFFESW